MKSVRNTRSAYYKVSDSPVMSRTWRHKAGLIFVLTTTAHKFIHNAAVYRFIAFLMKWPLIVSLYFVSFVTGRAPYGHIVVDWTSTKQTIDGFGAEAASDISLSSAMMDFFYTDTGIHLSLLRVEIFPGVPECESMYGTGHCVASSSATVLKTALATAQAAASRGAQVWGTEGSPPGYMKSNGSWTTGGSFLGGATNFARYATIQASFVSLMASHAVPVYTVSVQNEPDLSSRAHPSCT